MIVGEVCTCGATYEKFRAVGDDGHELTYASARDALRVGSHDPDLWRNKGRAAVLRLWGQLKRAQWDVTHGYCAQVAQERAEHGDTSFDVETFDNALVTPVVAERCDCDHCNPERWMKAAGLIKDTNTKGEDDARITTGEGSPRRAHAKPQRPATRPRHAREQRVRPAVPRMDPRPLGRARSVGAAGVERAAVG